MVLQTPDVVEARRYVMGAGQHGKNSGEQIKLLSVEMEVCNEIAAPLYQVQHSLWYIEVPQTTGEYLIG